MDVFRENPLDSAVDTLDPLQFLLIEQAVKIHTRNRSPEFRPSEILTGGFSRWRRGRDVIRQVDELCDQKWIELQNTILTARNDLVAHVVNARLREMTFAEEIRRAEALARMQQRLDFDRELDALELHSMRREVDEYWDAKRDDRQHRYRMELQGVQQDKDDPAYKAKRTVEAMDVFRPKLDEIFQSSDPKPVKHQRTLALFGIMQKTLG